VDDDDMFELTAMAFALLLNPDRVCDSCRHGEGSAECERPFALGETGLPTRGDDPTAVTRWPRCPGNYMALRRYGQELVPLSQLVDWAAERGYHRDPRLSAGGERLIREWLRIKEAPGVLKMRLERQQSGAAP
jgi:hypothetical protein